MSITLNLNIFNYFLLFFICLFILYCVTINLVFVFFIEKILQIEFHIYVVRCVVEDFQVYDFIQNSVLYLIFNFLPIQISDD